MNPQFVSKNSLSDTIGLSPETFKKYRLSGIWIKGIHWQSVNSRCVLYNLPLILDWLANRNSPQAHQRTIEAYLKALPSNQPKRGRKVS
ncbi:MAG: excisionase family protein [Scytolyngbya sp. HA4215-MV1]|nr:excisionase family protein [Scytolyngbya sp. HA4215-MV1]